MIKHINTKKREIAKQVLAVQLLSYRVEAELIDFYDIPPLKDTVATIQESEETFFAYVEASQLCGVISVKYENNDVQSLKSI